MARLVISSPPYTNRSDGRTLDKCEYLDFMRRVLSEIMRILSHSGVLVCVNTDLRDHARYNRGNRFFNGQVWFKHNDIHSIAQELGFQCFDCKIWAKTLRTDVMRYTFSYVVFYSKPGARMCQSPYLRGPDGFGPDVWLIEKGTRRKSSAGFIFRDAIHPLLVERCLSAFTDRGELVVSPFTGSGTVPAVAEMMGRDWTGYELNEGLEDLIRESIYGPNRPEVYRDLETRWLS